jgi:hypothetical protein
MTEGRTIELHLEPRVLCSLYMCLYFLLRNAGVVKSYKCCVFPAREALDALLLPVVLG